MSQARGPSEVVVGEDDPRATGTDVEAEENEGLAPEAERRL